MDKKFEPCSEADLINRAIEVIRAKSSTVNTLCPFPVTINFHPDRMTKEGKPILSAMAKDGVLKSQFQTGTSNGGLTAFHGGDRWKWEQRVFEGVYDQSSDHLRPKYGALQFIESVAGGAPRFGSSYFRLNPHVLERTTFCYPDSFYEPENFATAEQVSALIALAEGDIPDELDRYVEAHIHGEIRIDRDVDALVLDPIYQGTNIEKLANELPCKIEWHEGYRAEVDVFSAFPEYRGEEFIELARQIAVNNLITPDVLSHAIYQQGFDEQNVKKVWHYLARFGYGESGSV